MKVPTWWPPKVGDKLRGVRSPDAANDPLLHVVAVFRHVASNDDGDHIVVAEWNVTRQRWMYEVRSVVDALVGAVRPDGTPRVER